MPKLIAGAPEDDIVQQMVTAIVEEVHPAMVILFGSQARGNAREHSDVDLMVVEEGDFGPGRSRRAEASHLYRRLAGIGVPKDILVVTRAEIDKWRNSTNHVIGRALREGVVLHERG